MIYRWIHWIIFKRCRDKESSWCCYYQWDLVCHHYSVQWLKSLKWWLVGLNRFISSKINMHGDCGEEPSRQNYSHFFEMYQSELGWHFPIFFQSYKASALKKKVCIPIYLQDPGNVLSVWSSWLKPHQVFWASCLKRVAALNIIEIGFHSFCGDPLFSLCSRGQHVARRLGILDNEAC